MPGRSRRGGKVRAYPDPEQAAVLNRTFGCVRVVWNRTLATRQARYATEHTSTSYKDTDAALTALKKTPEYEWLNEVSSVPLQQTLRHQHTAFQAFFGKRARSPRFKSRRGKQSATYTRSAFRWREGELTLAKTATPLRVVWSWPDIDPSNPAPDHGDRVAGPRRPVVRDPARRRPLDGPGSLDACGGDVRQQGSALLLPPAKQEPSTVKSRIPVLQGGE
jgi:Helix-turn-helix domain